MKMSHCWWMASGVLLPLNQLWSIPDDKDHDGWNSLAQSSQWNIVLSFDFFSFIFFLVKWSFLVDSHLPIVFRCALWALGPPKMPYTDWWHQIIMNDDFIPLFTMDVITYPCWHIIYNIFKNTYRCILCWISLDINHKTAFVMNYFFFTDNNYFPCDQWVNAIGVWHHVSISYRYKPWTCRVALCHQTRVLKYMP